MKRYPEIKLLEGLQKKSTKVLILQINIREMIQAILEGTFQISPARRIYITKLGKKKMRPVGIPDFREKLSKTDYK